MKRTIVLLASCLAAVHGQSKYMIGAQGQSCTDACGDWGKTCNVQIETGGTTKLFTELGINGTVPEYYGPDQPSYVSGTSDRNYGNCIGFVGNPASSDCDASFPTVQRLCRCDETATDKAFENLFANEIKPDEARIDALEAANTEKETEIENLANYLESLSQTVVSLENKLNITTTDDVAVKSLRGSSI